MSLSVLCYRAGANCLSTARSASGPRRHHLIARRAMSAYATSDHLVVTQPAEFVFNVEMNRPRKMNALNKAMWEEIGDVFDRLGRDPDCRAVVISGAGKMFTSGIDLNDLSQLAAVIYGEEDIARKSQHMFHTIQNLQRQFTAMENCPKPVIAAVHSACVGAGVDLITATDIRLCTADAWFQVKEVDMGLAADVGTLQRLPKVIGSQSLVSELCLTARRMEAAEAVACGLVSRLYPDREAMMTAAVELAASIASKSPVAVQGTKRSLVYSREHTVQEGLDHVAMYNMTMLQSEDLMKSAMAAMDKSSPPPQFAKL